MDVISSILQRLGRLERQVRFSTRPISGTVVDNEDPNGRNRIKVICEELYGANGVSPWLVDRASINGNGIGSTWTPKLGSVVSIHLRDSNSDAGEYSGGARDENSSIPSRFKDPNINGIVTESGIVDEYNDVDGSRTFETESGKLVITADGTFHIYGIKTIIHTPTDLNADNPQFGIVTDNFICPVMGKNVVGSLSCKASAI